MRLREMMVTGWFIQLRPDLAVALGMDKAVVFQCLYTLLEQPGNGREVNGHRWIFNTYEQWQFRYFKFYSVSAIKRAFIELEKMGLIESCTPEGRMARRKYYRILDGALDNVFNTEPKRDRTKVKKRTQPSCSKSTMVGQLESVPITYIPSIDPISEEEWCRNQSPSAPDSRQSPFDSIREELSNPSKQRGGAAPEEEGCITPPAPNGRCVLTGWPTIEEFEDFLKERDFTDYICAKDQHEKFSNPKAKLNFQNMRDWRGVIVRLHQRKMRDRSLSSF